MKAVFNTARGAAADTLSIAETGTPSPAAGEVLVALKASGVNPSDSKLRSGAQGPMPAERVIVHNDGSGVVEAVGEGVDPVRIGQRVWLYNVNRTVDGLGQGAIGTAAEYVAAPSALAPALPETVSFESGACLGVPAMTAHRAILCAGPVDGKTVLVTGGAGAVGRAAIQIAAAKGARVIATVSSGEKAKIAREAGAETVIDYRAEDLCERLLAETDGGVDHVAEVDFAAHIQLYPRILRNGASVGAYATTSNLSPEFPFYPLAFRNIQAHPVFVYAMGDVAKAEAIHDINALLAAGGLTPLIARSFALDETAAAHEAVESGKLIGNAVIRI